MAAQIKPVGRFWGGDSSEESPSENESSLNEEESSEESEGSESESESSSSKTPSFGSISSDDEPRVVKPEKVRRREELKSVCDELLQKMKINDWTSIQTSFSKLNTQMERTVKAIGGGTIPKRYIRMLVRLEDFCLQTWSDVEGRKKLSPTNAKALNTLKHKILKHNKNFVKEIAEIRAHPLPSEEGSDLSEESETGGGDVAPEEPSEGGKKQDSFRTMDPADITYAMVSEKLIEIQATRGKKGTDKHERLEMLQYLVTVARGSSQTVTVLSHVVSCMFDLNPSITSHMRVSQWKYCVYCCFQILDILKEHPNIQLVEEMDQLEDLQEAPAENSERNLACCPLASFVERLDDELFKSLQVIDPHTHLYLQRLKDEVFFLALGGKVLEFVQSRENMRGKSMLALRLMDHYYYKSENVYLALRSLAIRKQSEEEALEDNPSTSFSLLSKRMSFL